MSDLEILTELNTLFESDFGNVNVFFHLVEVEGLLTKDEYLYAVSLLNRFKDNHNFFN